jgi:anti-sigma regulatory factor (Ser/Thr protein kinase)
MSDKIEGTFINAKFKPRARLLLQLGDQLIKNESIALIELVKNAYDADANIVTVLMDIPDDTTNGTIMIEDDGYGMTKDIVENAWLEPGSDFKTKKIANNEVSPKYNRLPIGEKGIGRFGVHKLGNVIELVTKSANSKEVYVKIDWSTFNDYKYLEDVPIRIFERDNPKTFKDGKTGTLITISNLHKTWERGVAREIKRAITSLISPFETKDSFKPNFDIANRPNWFDGLLKWEEVKELSLYHFKAKINGSCITSFEYEFTPWASMPKLEYKNVGIDDKLVSSYKTLKYTDEKNKEIAFSLDGYSIGEVTFEGYVFDLDSYILSLGVSDKTGFKKYMKSAGGVSVFRDGLRVYDYGEPENDWLGLDYRRFVSPTKAISNNLILGAVFINRKDSKDLIEKTNREGFIENEAYKAFKNSILHIFDCVEVLRITDKRRLKEFYGPTKKSAPVMSLLSEAQIYVQENVKEEEVKNELIKFFGKIEADYIRVNENLLKAAGAGLSMSIVVHEVDKIIIEVIKVLTSEKASERVLKLVKHLSSLIDGYAEIVRKSNQSNENVIEIIDQALFNTEYRLAAHKVQLVKDYQNYKGGTKVKIARNLLIGSLMNVLDNSIYWLERAKEAKPSLVKSIYINIIEEENYLNVIFADNGTGFLIPTDDIVEPFVTAKPNGIGLGLHISNEIMLAQKGKLIFPNAGDFEIPNDFIDGATIVFALKK